MQTNAGSCSVSAVIPVYNDRESLKKAIPVAVQYLEKIAPFFELIIAEDASTDGSYELACEYARADRRITVLHRNERLGRGSALNAAAGMASGDIFCYFDVDMATDMAHLPDLIRLVGEGNDIATGSRYISGSRVTRSLNREFKSRIYNVLVRLFLRGLISDYQCGFKAFRRDKLLVLLPFIRDTHWFWDTEVLIHAERNRYRITEIPILWKEGPDTTVRRSDCISMGMSVLELWFRFLIRSPDDLHPES
jgi:glycosyltransferase involved in cell wall biosynthesis